MAAARCDRGQSVAVRGQLVAARGQLVAVRWQLVAVRGQLVAVRGQLGVLVGYLFGSAPGFDKGGKNSLLEGSLKPGGT